VGDDRAALQLAGPGTILPVPAPSLAAAERVTAPTLARWRAALFETTGSPDKEHPADELRLALSTGRDG
jgi:hypothetical protein